MGSWARRTSLGILMWNKRRLVSRRPSWKVGGSSICTFWFSLESQVLKTRLRITYCFAFFFFFFLWRKIAHRSVGGDDYCTASQEVLRWRGEAAWHLHASQLAVQSEVPVQQQSPDPEWFFLFVLVFFFNAGLGRGIFYMRWSEELRRILCVSIEVIGPVTLTLKSRLKLPLKAP